MKIKTIQLAKTDVSKLDGDDLVLLSKFKKSKEFSLLESLSNDAKSEWAKDFVLGGNEDDLTLVRGMTRGVDFILDSVNRAREELKSRGDKVDRGD